MSQITHLLEFVRQQRRLVGQMENTLAKAASTLIEAQYLEQKQRTECEDSSQTQNHLRGLANRKIAIRSTLVQYNEEVSRLYMGLETFCNTLPLKEKV